MLKLFKLYWSHGLFAILSGMLPLYFLSKGNVGTYVYGLYVVLISLASITSDVFGIRTSDLPLKYLSLSRNDADKKFVISTITAVSLLFSLINLGVILLLSKWLLSFFETGISETKLLVYLAVIPIVNGFREISNSLLIFEDKQLSVDVLRNIRPFVFFMVIVLRGSLDLAEVVVAAILSYSPVLIFDLINIGKHIGCQLEFHNHLKKPMLADLRNIYMSLMLKAGGAKLDAVLVNIIVGPNSVAIYDLVKKLMAPTVLLYNPLIQRGQKKLVDALLLYRNEAVTLILNISRNPLIVSLVYGILLVVFMPHFIDRVSGDLTVLLVVTVIVVLVRGMRWWTKLYSTTVDSRISIVMNAFSLLLTGLILGLGKYTTMHFGVFGFVEVLITSIWLVILFRR